MSLDIDWDAITGGEDGVALAETVRNFIHDKFQEIPLPRFIKAVKVNGFDFGKVPPEIEVKDICDPLDDFYDDDEGDDSGQEQRYTSPPEADKLQAVHNHEQEQTGARIGPAEQQRQAYAAGLRDLPDASGIDHLTTRPHYGPKATPTEQLHHVMLPPPHAGARPDNSAHGAPPAVDHFKNIAGLRSSTPTPGIPGGTSSLNYFHLPLTAGLSGTATPLAAVAGAHFPHNWPDLHTDPDPGRRQGHETDMSRRAAASNNSLTPPSTADSSLWQDSQRVHGAEARSGLPPSLQTGIGARVGEGHGDLSMLDRMYADVGRSGPQQHGNVREAKAEDAQLVAHVTYQGDIKLSLTAEILLDYPTESFVGIPLQLTITGLSFDGFAILAYIQRRAHFCFLSPEDAGIFNTPDPDEAVDSRISRPKPAETVDQPRGADRYHPPKVGGLLDELHVESEIGERGSGKQVLKNVGKVEKFILEQVRRIFEDEFVYPSFWTFLV